MGTRSALGLMLLCFVFLSLCLIQSCNRELEPTAIDISQPTLQKPPTELWRKRVVTKPPTEEKIREMDFKKMAKAHGWTLAQSPILLPDGDLLCVTKNESIETDEKGKPDRVMSNPIFDEYTMHRLVIVTSRGKIRLHKEYKWGKDSKVVPDPTGEYLAFVTQDTYSPANDLREEESRGKTITALDYEMNVANTFPIESPDLAPSSLSISDKAFFWQSIEIDFGAFNGENFNYDTSKITSISEVYSMNRNGSVLWNFKMPDASLTDKSIAFSPITVGDDSNIYLCHTDGYVYAFNTGGEVIWKTPLEYSFKSHPVLLQDGNMALIGDKSHEVKMPDFTSIMAGFEDIGKDGYSPPSMDEIEQNQKKIERELDSYQREIFSLPGFMFILSNDGEVLTERKLPSLPRGGPLVLGENKILLNIAGKINNHSGIDQLTMFDISSRLMCLTVEGEILWDKAFDTGFLWNGIHITNLPSDKGKCIVAAGVDGNLYALDGSGELLWVITGTHINRTSLTVGANGLIYVVDAGELVCYQMK